MHLTVMQNKSSPFSGKLSSGCEAEKVERVNENEDLYYRPALRL